MKLSLATTILATAIPSVTARLTSVATSVASDENDFQLERKQLGWHAITGLELEMHNVVQDYGISHLEEPAVVTAFTEAFEEVFDGMETKWAFIDEAVTREEEAGRLAKNEGRLGSYYMDWMWIFADGYCRLCPDDFMVTETTAEDTAVTGTTSSFMHDQRWSQVGPLLCDKLKATGEDRYAKVDGCSIRPTYASGRDSAALASKKKVSSVSRKTPTSSGTTKGSITVHNIHPSSSVNVETIKAALTDAYMKVHEDSLFTVTDVTLEREITFPETGSVSSSSGVHMEGSKIAIVGNGASSDEYLTGMFWVDLAWTCLGSGCNNDSTLPGLVLSPREQVNKYTPNGHKVFEGYFCHNLRVSGDSSFGEASGCKISFSDVSI
jgi:hypothetical protein